jgi:hypothetical protein
MLIPTPGLDPEGFKLEFAKSLRLEAFVRHTANLQAGVPVGRMQKATLEVLKTLKSSATTKNIPRTSGLIPTRPNPHSAGMVTSAEPADENSNTLFCQRGWGIHERPGALNLEYRRSSVAST